METSNTPIQPTEYKPPVIPVAIKNFFFYGLKKSAKVKKVAKEYGEVLKIGYIIVPPKNSRIMRVICKDAQPEIDFTEEELEQFLKVLNKTKEDVQKCKLIFVLFDLTTKCVSYQQETLDGKKLNFTI